MPTIEIDRAMRDEIVRLQERVDWLQKYADALVGETFGDRVHFALQDRARKAEVELAAARLLVASHEDAIVDLRVCVKGVTQQRDELRAAVRELAERFRNIAGDGFDTGSALAPAYDAAADAVEELLEGEP